MLALGRVPDGAHVPHDPVREVPPASHCRSALVGVIVIVLLALDLTLPREELVTLAAVSARDLSERAVSPVAQMLCHFALDRVDAARPAALAAQSIDVQRERSAERQTDGRDALGRGGVRAPVHCPEFLDRSASRHRDGHGALAEPSVGRACLAGRPRADRDEAPDALALDVRSHDERDALLADDHAEPRELRVSKPHAPGRPKLEALKEPFGDVDGTPVVCAVAHLLPSLQRTG
ncbi:MAG TPA: hypothetical protein VN253_29580 [Kofleriaceae bacterium]|nr:hypothetical protein [Kofleriaceae bacterium]